MKGKVSQLYNLYHSKLEFLICKGLLLGIPYAVYGMPFTQLNSDSAIPLCILKFDCVLTIIHKSFIRPQDMFNGTWNEVSKTNIEEVLKKMGYNWAVRKVAIAMGMTLVIKGLRLLFRYENVGRYRKRLT